MAQEKIPQNIQALIADIGEKMVLFKLFEKSNKHKELEIYKNYSDVGYDIGIRNNDTGQKIRVEVKTRQRLITTGKSRNNVHFTLTSNEFHNSDFVVGYWIEKNDFFIVPTIELDESNSGSKKVYKLIVTDYKNGSGYSPRMQNLANNWERVIKAALQKETLES
jgi:hypothetical protein